MMQNRFSYITHVAAAICLLLGISCALSGFKAPGYSITGKIAGKDSALFYLTYDYDGKQIINVSELMSNKIIFNGHLPEPVICTLSNSVNKQIKVFVAENADIQLNGAIDKLYELKVKNSREDSLYSEFKTKSGFIASRYRADIKQTGSDLHNKLSKPYLAYQERMDSLTTAFVEAHKNTTAAALAIIDSYINNADKGRAAACYKRLSAAGQKTIYAKRILQFIETATTISPGHVAPDFALADSAGRMVKLSDLKGKYVLVDFWASWCVPCRETHPLLKTLHEKFSAYTNLVFVGISMDASIQSWKQAVNADQLTWLQLNDPKSMNGSVADVYGVKSIPFNCLIDPDGIIMATNLHGHDLQLALMGITLWQRKK